MPIFDKNLAESPLNPIYLRSSVAKNEFHLCQVLAKRSLGRMHPSRGATRKNLLDLSLAGGMECIVAGPADTDICILIASYGIVAAAAQDAIVSLIALDVVIRWTAQDQVIGNGAGAVSASRRAYNDDGQSQCRALRGLDGVGVDRSCLVGEAGCWNCVSRGYCCDHAG